MDELEYINSLVEYLNARTKEYDEGYPTISDKEWDEKYFELVRLEKKTGITMVNSPTQKVDYRVVSELEKVEHNHPMLSLDKTKDWDEFVGYFDLKDVTGMLKLDGLTCSLRYENGWLVSAETRGNGVVGENILHNAKVIPSIPNYIPEYTEELIVDGEIICTDEDFKPFSETYANSRNFASGSIRLLDSKECASRNLTFVVWNVIKGFDEMDSFCDRLSAVDYLGFKVVPWTSSFDWDAKEFLINKAKELGYPIDGLVGRFDSISYGNSLGETGHHSRAAYAFKFYDEEYETTLRNIEWTMGRTGILTPVAIFDPIDDGVSVIERASLHNVSVLKETLHYPVYGQKIKVFKANQIIPQISWAEKVDLDTIIFEQSLIIPDNCPICGQAANLSESDTGTINLVCSNPHCEGKLINRLDHFCGKKGLDIKGLSTATLEKLIDWGWVKSISDIYKLHTHKTEWIQKAGFGKKSVENILNAIEGSKTCELSSFICAIGIPLIGSTYAKAIAKEECTWVEFRDDIDENANFALLDGFGPEMAYSISHFNYDEADALSNCLNIKNSLWGESFSPEASTLTGQTIVITGKLNIYKNRAALQEAIESAGGKVVSSVSKNTTYLINNDNTSTSSKNVAAQKLNIPILTEVEFVEKFLKNI